MNATTRTGATRHEVRGGGGLRLHVREWGRPDGQPIVLIHGWSQNHLCWAHQYDSALADEFRLVAYDLRGHGMSDAPLDAAHYTDAALWADDLAAVIEALDLQRSVLVGWSYGAFVICDYIRRHGQGHVAAINLVEGCVKLDESAFGTLIGPGFLDHFVDATADDLPTNIRAMRSFVRTCLVRPIDPDELETAVCWNVTVPAKMRAHLAARQIDGDDVLRHARRAGARHPGTRRHRRPPGDGRAHPRHRTNGHRVLVRRSRPRPAHRSTRPVQPGARRAQPHARRQPRRGSISIIAMTVFSPGRPGGCCRAGASGRSTLSCVMGMRPLGAGGSCAAGAGRRGGEAGDEGVEGVAPEALGVGWEWVAAELGPCHALAQGTELCRRLGDAAAAE